MAAQRLTSIRSFTAIKVNGRSFIFLEKGTSDRKCTSETYRLHFRMEQVIFEWME